MAGITAILNGQRTADLHSLLRSSLESSFPFPNLQTIVSTAGGSRVAMGGTIPRAFHRSAGTTTRGDTSMLFYGEIYNELRGECQTERVHRAFFGGSTNDLAELNGPFTAFAWDESKAELTVITDRLGRFPVFYGSSIGVTVVTTDLHSVLNAAVLAGNLREESIVDFLTIGFPLGDESMFRGIKRLAGGKMMTISPAGVSVNEYWKHEFRSSNATLDELVAAFKESASRTMHLPGNSVITLSGGWDSRATCSALADEDVPPHTVTYGVPRSTDTEIAGVIAGELGTRHMHLSPGRDFFDSFEKRARDVVAMSNGHATVDLAFQLYMYERLSEDFDAVIDSAGCEFRRGVRARMAAKFARRTEDISRYLTKMYSTGIWHESIIATDFFRGHRTYSFDTLTGWLDDASDGTYEAKIDAFSAGELWAHHYAHGYPLQTNIIGCRMPFSDNTFYDLFLGAKDEIRWSHKVHRSVIRKFAPRLESIPISYGSCSVPYGESPARFIPVLFHVAATKVASAPFLSWMRTLDSYAPFRPYQTWYSRELWEYVNDTLSSTICNTYLDPAGVQQMFRDQKSGQRDSSHSISILLTFVHLLEYERSLRTKCPRSYLS